MPQASRWPSPARPSASASARRTYCSNALARLACDVPEEIDDAPVFAAIRSLMDAFDQLTDADPTDRRRLSFLILAATVANTPDVPLPAPAEVTGTHRAT